MNPGLHMKDLTTVLSTSLGQTCFARHFLFSLTIFFSETICLLCFCVLFSNIYPKIKFNLLPNYLHYRYICVMYIGWALNHDRSLQIYLFCAKYQACASRHTLILDSFQLHAFFRDFHVT